MEYITNAAIDGALNVFSTATNLLANGIGAILSSLLSGYSYQDNGYATITVNGVASNIGVVKSSQNLDLLFGETIFEIDDLGKDSASIDLISSGESIMQFNLGGIMDGTQSITDLFIPMIRTAFEQLTGIPTEATKLLKMFPYIFFEMMKEFIIQESVLVWALPLSVSTGLKAHALASALQLIAHQVSISSSESLISTLINDNSMTSTEKIELSQYLSNFHFGLRIGGTIDLGLHFMLLGAKNKGNSLIDHEGKIGAIVAAAYSWFGQNLMFNNYYSKFNSPVPSLDPISFPFTSILSIFGFYIGWRQMSNIFTPIELLLSISNIKKVSKLFTQAFTNLASAQNALIDHVLNEGSIINKETMLDPKVKDATGELIDVINKKRTQPKFILSRLTFSILHLYYQYRLSELWGSSHTRY
ncbi:MAG: hypothetical protein INQ03_17405 [Candidatus Heimdallarchaeota archaeon]|nr:hypothetical protein [Candidatus Heimdallarchaeota archaeon]